MWGRTPRLPTRIPALEATFPGALYVLMHRDPAQAIPSRLNLLCAIWRRRFPGFEAMTEAQIATILADSTRTYVSAARDLPALPSERWHVVDYADLSADPVAAVRGVYEALRLGAPPPSALAQAAQRPDRGASADASGRGPRPTLADFGLEDASVRASLGRRWDDPVSPP